MKPRVAGYGRRLCCRVIPRSLFTLKQHQPLSGWGKPDGITTLLFPVGGQTLPHSPQPRAVQSLTLPVKMELFSFRLVSGHMVTPSFHDIPVGCSPLLLPCQAQRLGWILADLLHSPKQPCGPPLPRLGRAKLRDHALTAKH